MQFKINQKKTFVINGSVTSDEWHYLLGRPPGRPPPPACLIVVLIAAFKKFCTVRPLNKEDTGRRALLACILDFLGT